jgi:hypothetical protein
MTAPEPFPGLLFITLMYSPNDPDVLWVSPNGGATGNGTLDEPFGTIASALAKARPGSTVVLLEGLYPGDATIQVSGSVDMPLRIVAAAESKAVISEGCWYFYDVCDLIVSGLVFRDAPQGAISVMGACERNRFERIRFENCGRDNAASCTLFFGGSGAACNIVEFCEFCRPAIANVPKKEPSSMNVGLMISEGDSQEGKPITNIIVRRNRFSKYDYGILAGARDYSANQYGHCIDYNSIDDCAAEGIMVKCGDTQVKGNVITNCPGSAITVATGEGTVVSDNRIADSGLGIRVSGKGHTIANNCIIRSGAESILILGKNGSEGVETQNIIVEHNTLAFWSKNSALPAPAIAIHPETSAIVRRNLFTGSGEPLRFTGQKAGGRHHIADNARANGTGSEGVIETTVIFTSAETDDYGNNSEFGAKGWTCGPKEHEPDSEENQEKCGHCGKEDTDAEHARDEMISPMESFSDKEETLRKSLFFGEHNRTNSEDL